MATRATYQIENQTFYCHWDGYPTGAAQRFANMIGALTVAETGDRKGFETIEQRRGGMAFAFIRGNMDAEPTESHSAHGDTEYRYTVKTEPNGETKISVHAVDINRFWRLQGITDLADWLNAQRGNYAHTLVAYWARTGETDKPGKTLADAQAEALEVIPVIVRCEVSRYATKPQIIYATLPNAKAIKTAHAKLAGHYKADNPNQAIETARMRAWGQAIAAATDQKVEA